MLDRSGIDYETQVEGDPTKGPKSKVPFIVDGDVRMGDSYFIEKHLNTAHGVDFYENLSASDIATARLAQSAIEEKLYWVMVYSRWQVEENWPIMEEIFFGQMPPEMRKTIGKLALDSMRTSLWGHGMGRHTPDEVYGIGIKIIDHLATILGDGDYFVGDKFTSLDASAYGCLINFVQNPVPTPLKAQIMGMPNLCRFLDAMSERHFPNAVRLMSEDKRKAG